MILRTILRSCATWSAGRIILLASTIWSAGCTSAPVTVDRPVRVEIPVPVPCVESVPARPLVAQDSELALLPDGPLVLTLHRDRLALRVWAEEMAALLEGCRKLP